MSDLGDLLRGSSSSGQGRSGPTGGVTGRRPGITGRSAAPARAVGAARRPPTGAAAGWYYSWGNVRQEARRLCPPGAAAILAT
jgi:hypothetical protein